MRHAETDPPPLYRCPRRHAGRAEFPTRCGPASAAQDRAAPDAAPDTTCRAGRGAARAVCGWLVDGGARVDVSSKHRLAARAPAPEGRKTGVLVWPAAAYFLRLRRCNEGVKQGPHRRASAAARHSPLGYLRHNDECRNQRYFIYKLEWKLKWNQTTKAHSVHVSI